ncbi:MAG: hypothetical protein AAFY99_11960 [Pseudomonadota bacterium]
MAKKASKKRDDAMFATKYAMSAALLLGSIVNALGKNTAEDWKWASEYYATYGEWTVGCDQRSDDERVKRCYLRYVDAYARNPFGALFVFATANANDGLKFNFEYEAGVRFTKPWRVVNGSTVTWQFDPALCPPGSECALTGTAADNLADALNANAGEMTFALRDRVFRSFELRWPTAGFIDALADLKAQSEARNL